MIVCRSCEVTVIGSSPANQWTKNIHYNELLSSQARQSIVYIQTARNPHTIMQALCKPVLKMSDRMLIKGGRGPMMEGTEFCQRQRFTRHNALSSSIMQSIAISTIGSLRIKKLHCKTQRTMDRNKIVCYIYISRQCHPFDCRTAEKSISCCVVCDRYRFPGMMERKTILYGQQSNKDNTRKPGPLCRSR